MKNKWLRVFVGVIVISLAIGMLGACASEQTPAPTTTKPPITVTTTTAPTATTTVTATPSPPPAAEVIKWRALDHLTRDTVRSLINQDYCDLVQLMSDGRLNLTYYATAELMPTDQIPDAIINGMVEWYHSYGPYFSGKIGTLCDMEGGCTNKLSLEGQWNVWNAGAGDILRRAYAEQNLHYITFLGLHPIGGDNVYSREELDSVEDLRGLKFRSIGISAEIMTNLGASCTYFPWEELYLALQTGTVDAAEMATPSEMFDLGLAEVAKHWYYPAFISSGWCNYVANMDAYDSLPLDLRAIVDQAGMAVNVRHGAEPWVMDYERIPEFIEAGVVIHQWTEEDMDKFVAAWIKAFNEMGESGDPYCKEFYDVVKQTRTKLDEWPEQ